MKSDPTGTPTTGRGALIESTGTERRQFIWKLWASSLCTIFSLIVSSNRVWNNDRLNFWGPIRLCILRVLMHMHPVVWNGDCLNLLGPCKNHMILGLYLVDFNHFFFLGLCLYQLLIFFIYLFILIFFLLPLRISGMTLTLFFPLSCRHSLCF